MAKINNMKKATKTALEVVCEVSGLLPETVEQNYKWVLTAIQTYIDQFKPKKEPKLKIEIPQDKIEEYNNIFPKMTFGSGKRARSADKEVEKAFQWFFKNYVEYTDWQIILDATRLYISEKEQVNWDFASTSQYFIVKFKTPSMPVSILVDYYERIKEGDLPNEEVKAMWEPKVY